jgi:flagellar basal-body rod modification protein FlgD
MAVSAIANPVATTDTSAITTQNDAGSADRFLKLLVAQMKNQDPLNPMDNAQVTSQMAQINTVNGIEKLNRTVEGLSGNFVQLQALQGASLVGRDVIVPGKLLDIAEGVGQGGFELTGPADAVKVEVLAPSGQVVEALNLGAQGSGMHSFDWVAGSATNDSALSFRVTATTGGVSTSPTTLMRDKVTAISTTTTGFNLETAHAGTLPYASVRAFN